MSDARGCITLSGGVDSSLISATAFNLNLGLPRVSLKSAEDNFDESKDVLAHAKAIGLEVAFVQESGEEEFLIQDYKIAARLMNTPYFDSYSAQKQLYLGIRDLGYKFSLDGHGADELFDGYQWSYAWYSFVSFLRFDFIGCRKSFKIFWDSYPPYFTAIRKIYVFSLSIIRQSMSLKRSYFGVKPRLELQARYKLVFGSVMLRLLNNYDSCGMQSSVEVRSPFLDHRIVACAINRDIDIKSSHNKPILRNWLEKNNLQSPTTKIGFRSSLTLERRILEELRKKGMPIFSYCVAKFFLSSSIFERRGRQIVSRFLFL